MFQPFKLIHFVLSLWIQILNKRLKYHVWLLKMIKNRISWTLVKEFEMKYRLLLFIIISTIEYHEHEHEPNIYSNGCTILRANVFCIQHTISDPHHLGEVISPSSSWLGTQHHGDQTWLVMLCVPSCVHHCEMAVPQWSSPRPQCGFWARCCCCCCYGMPCYVIF